MANASASGDWIIPEMVEHLTVVDEEHRAPINSSPTIIGHPADSFPVNMLEPNLYDACTNVPPVVQRSHVPHRPQNQRRPAASNSLPPAEYPAPSSETDPETTAAILPTSSCRPATGSQTIPPSSRLPCSAGIAPRRLSVRPRRPAAAVAPSRHPRAIHAAPGSRGTASQSALTTILLLPLGRPAVPAASESRHAASSSALAVLLLPLVRPAPPLPPPRSSCTGCSRRRGLVRLRCCGGQPRLVGRAAAAPRSPGAARVRPARQAWPHGGCSRLRGRGGGCIEMERQRVLGLFRRVAMRLHGGDGGQQADVLEEAVEDYRSPAELGHPVGICNLGVSYLEGTVDLAYSVVGFSLETCSRWM
ncbi:sel1-like repeat [Panicum miliaceum]|uniref:Sel1-like repeat n=1 Tax=Panicum miliaceum TaxID=4540 RepID=A0A3L6T5C7_PANMI|nr:sel1-like repeat [Panicum miliaceum]